MSRFYRDKARLSEQERAVLSAAEFRARAPLSEIARDCGSKEAAVRYILKKLTVSGIILSRRAYMNPYLIGFTNYTLYVSLASWREKDREGLARFLTLAPRVTWFAEMGGDHQYAVSLYAQHVNEFMEFRDRISQQFSACIADQAVSVRVAFWNFPRKFLAKARYATRKHRELCQGGPSGLSIDEVDAKVLSTLSHSGFESFRQLAERSDIPLSTFDRRVNSLQDRRLVQGYYYMLDSAKLGFEEFRLLVHAQAPSKKLTDRLLAFSREHPHVRKFVQCISDWDYEMDLCLPSAREVSSVIAELNERFRSELKRIRVLSLFSQVSCPPFPEGRFE